MKKFVTDVALFSLFAGAFYVLGVVAWGFAAPPLFRPNIQYNLGSKGHVHTRLSEAKTYGGVDILFLGSSHTYRGFDTRIFAEHGYRAFNLGSSAQPPSVTRVLLDRYLDSLNPRLVVYEVFPETFLSDGVESLLDVMANDGNDWSTVRLALRANNVKVYNTLLYSLARELTGRDASFSEPTVRGDDTYVAGGFVEKEVRYNNDELVLREKEIDLHSRQFAAFGEILAMLRARDITPVFVFAPLTSQWYGSYTNIEAFDSTMRTHGTYYNANELVSLHDSLHFYDSHHLNQRGVRLFNDALVSAMKTDGILD